MACTGTCDKSEHAAWTTGAACRCICNAVQVVLADAIQRNEAAERRNRAACTRKAGHAGSRYAKSSTERSVL